jgi:hypothetical protein
MDRLYEDRKGWREAVLARVHSPAVALVIALAVALVFALVVALVAALVVIKGR